MKGTPVASIETVRITGDEEKDATALLARGKIDAVLDLSPPHLNSAILPLRWNGRVSLIGAFMEGSTSSFQLVAKDITIKGKLYVRET